MGVVQEVHCSHLSMVSSLPLARKQMTINSAAAAAAAADRGVRTPQPLL